MHDIALRRRAIAHMGDIAHIDGGAVDDLDRQLIHLFDGVGRVVELHRILVTADLGEAGRHDLVLAGQRRLDIGGRKAMRLHRLGIQVKGDFASLAAIGQ